MNLKKGERKSMTKIIVSPSILSGDFGNMANSVKMADEWGADWIHCDVMDGVYVPNFTFGMPMVEAINKATEKPLDVHLMMTNPEKYVERFVKAGADYVTFHPEASSDAENTLELIKKAGAKAGLAFNPDVKIENYEYLFEKCDIIVVMTVFAGYGGQKLIDYCLDRITYVKNKLAEKNIDVIIQADGGVTEENVATVVEAGATAVVAGSAVFKSSNPKETIKKLKGEK